MNLMNVLSKLPFLRKRKSALCISTAPAIRRGDEYRLVARMLTLKRNSAMLVLAAIALLPTVAGAGEWIDLEQSGGQALFGEKCGMCHRASGMGTGILARRLDPEQALLENRSDLQPAFVSTVVRNGFGLMFPLSRGEVSDPQLDAIADYLAHRAAGEE